MPAIPRADSGRLGNSCSADAFLAAFCETCLAILAAAPTPCFRETEKSDFNARSSPAAAATACWALSSMDIVAGTVNRSRRASLEGLAAGSWSSAQTPFRMRWIREVRLYPSLLPTRSSRHWADYTRADATTAYISMLVLVVVGWRPDVAESTDRRDSSCGHWQPRLIHEF